MTALNRTGRTDIQVVGGRYGLGSKDTTPASIIAVYENLKLDEPKNSFTIGIVDDVTGHSLEEKVSPDTAPAGTIACKFWGLGGDGTVGANKNSIKIIGDHTDKYIQAYFQYDSKKTGGVTVSHLRFGDTPIKSPYYITKADFVACHNVSYILKGFKIVQDVKPGGTFLLDCRWNAEELEEHLPASVKKYIAKNNIKFYTIDATTLATVKIGNAKVKNTILQSAFFALANILPKDEAIEYMKKMAYKSYAKKGDEIVQLNYNAIDAGADAVTAIDVPAAWAELADEAPAAAATGERADLVKFVNEIVTPVNNMDGDSLPVSTFVDMADGTFPQGAAAYEKRGVAVYVPEWDPTNCIQCNTCAFVCPHATIRPYALTAEEAANAPANTKYTEKPVLKTDYKFTMAISPMDCMGCTLCVKACPVSARSKETGKAAPLTMKAQSSQLDQQPVFDYCVANVSEKTELVNATVKGSQFKQPLLEFSGSCAGCAETSYARLVTQLFGEQMYISNATGCSSIWGGSAPSTPYTVNRESGKGPAWGNSLFEDNAEHGLGMFLGQRTLRNRAISMIEALDVPAEKKEIVEKFLATKDSSTENAEPAKALIAMLEEAAAGGCEASKEIVKTSDLVKTIHAPFYINLNSEDVNVFVFDTEVYSNTGGQASKASQLGQVAQFAAAGKQIGKKSLSEIAMSYGYVYVAQVAMGADKNQLLKALKEAEAYRGPSLIIGYAPCEMHRIKKGGMQNCQLEMQKAVDAGYWNLFRFNPALKAEGKNPFSLDSKAPKTSYIDFIEGEVRYASLKAMFPEKAEKLFAQAAENAQAKYERLVRLVDYYAPKAE